jgi:hypothetical protein
VRPHANERSDDIRDDGGCFVSIFAGPRAEDRARDYFEALRTGKLLTYQFAN